jgi:hypothetical protein
MNLLAFNPDYFYVSLHCHLRSHAWRSCGFSEHFTVNLPLKPNRSATLEFKHITLHDAKCVLAVVYLSSFVNLSSEFN